MAAISGIDGQVIVGSDPVAEINAWDGQTQRKMLPSTIFGQDWEDNVPSTANVSGKATGFWTPSDTNGQTALVNAYLNRTLITLKLYEDASHYWTFSAYIKGISEKTQVDGLVTRDFDFTGTGTLSIV